MLVNFINDDYFKIFENKDQIKRLSFFIDEYKFMNSSFTFFKSNQDEAEKLFKQMSSVFELYTNIPSELNETENQKRSMEERK